MCGIAGFCSFDMDYTSNQYYWHSILVKMREEISHRGKDDTGEYLKKNVGLSQTRLTIRDLFNGNQPMTRVINENEYTIVYNGEIYNMEPLKADLISKGYSFETTTDTEVILYAYIEYGIDSVKMLNGIFAYAIWDDRDKKLYLFRDRCGIKPLFYSLKRNTIVFGSEIKSLFKHPKVSPEIDNNSLREIFGIGPARTEGNGVFKGVFEIKYGHYGVYDINGFKEYPYWSLKSEEYTKSYEEAVDDVRYLVTSAIEYQMVSDVPVCSFLSGGLDSCIVTAVAANYLAKKGKTFNTFSFDFKDNNKYFVSNSFQPEQDRPYVDIMLNNFNVNHTYLECSNEELADYLYLSVDAKDLPGMADVDASMLYFCKLVKEHNKVTLTGECADEIFGGYPWFHRDEFINADTFPWSVNYNVRNSVLNDDAVTQLDLKGYIDKQYKHSISQVPILEGEDTLRKRQREISFLNLKWFMTTLLDRMDRASMYSGLEARVPYADHRIIEYMWNVPWEYKCPNGITKGLLRDSAKNLLPEEIVYRKKSPYPKTYNPNYEKILKERVAEIMSDNNAPILPILNKQEVNTILNSTSDYGKPWFGQLMATPQLLAYIIQVNYWLKKFDLSL
ncbi:MAG: asparagine synthase (glutamine-hydrolyzing) [Clostridia bacterium]|nr:asparagine synthase (glutamine-hydrolyzing) [Clostridia bacterium]